MVDENIATIRKNKNTKRIIGIGVIIIFLSYSGIGFSQDAQSYYQNGYQYFSQEKYQQAEENYKKAIELDSNFENAHYWLGKVYRQTGQHDKAITQWIEVLRINPRNSYAFRYLNESFRDTSRVTGGVSGDYYLEGLRILGVQQDTFLNESNVGSYTLLSAIPYFRRVSESDKDAIGANYWMGEIYQALSKKISWQYTSLAISSFEKSIALEEKSNPSLFLRPQEYWYSYQELLQIFQSLGLNERKENLLNQLQEVKAKPYIQALQKAGYDDLGYPDSIEIIKTDSEELIELWRYEKEDKVFRVINKEVVGEEKPYL
ncbi:MAG: tetratricopeptide repeat protein [Atribacterota bacterium]|nr:tetratricopeptide repeat protein [Atribacterota bacterium]